MNSGSCSQMRSSCKCPIMGGFGGGGGGARGPRSPCFLDFFQIFFEGNHLSSGIVQ